MSVRLPLTSGVQFSKASNVCWPGAVGDGGEKTITNTDTTGATKQMQTYVGAGHGTTLRRFLVGPVECEITGLAESPDGRALFVNIQHPGEETAAANIGDPALLVRGLELGPAFRLLRRRSEQVRAVSVIAIDAPVAQQIDREFEGLPVQRVQLAQHQRLFLGQRRRESREDFRGG